MSETTCLRELVVSGRAGQACSPPSLSLWVGSSQAVCMEPREEASGEFLKWLLTVLFGCCKEVGGQLPLAGSTMLDPALWGPDSPNKGLTVSVALQASPSRLCPLYPVSTPESLSKLPAPRPWLALLRPPSAAPLPLCLVTVPVIESPVPTAKL